MFLKLVEWYAKRQAKKLANQYNNDPKMQKDVEDANKAWAEFEKNSKNLSKSIQAYIANHPTDENKDINLPKQKNHRTEEK